MKKLVLIGSDSIHLYNYYMLVHDFFDEVIVITNSENNTYACKTVNVSFSLKNIGLFNRTIKTIREVVDTFKPSVIHIHQANTVAFTALMALHKFVIPKILTAWGSDILLADSKSTFYKRMLHYNLNHVQYCTSDSSHMAAVMSSYFSDKNRKVVIANFGIDIDEHSTTPPKKNIIYSNRLHNKLYRIDKIIIAFDKFLKSHPSLSWKLIIAGTGDETDNLKQLATKLGIDKDVEFAGWVDKELNYDYYKKAKLFVSIPESDATSASLLEAMAFGCLPIVSKLPANMEWITQGINGVIVENIDSDFISEALSINYQTCVETNRKLIQERASKESQRSIFLNLYKNILEKQVN